MKRTWQAKHKLWKTNCPPQVTELDHIYPLSSGRLPVTALTEHSVDYVAESIDRGSRSMISQLPILGLKGIPVDETIEALNSLGSTALVMIEDKHGVDAADEIAAIVGVEFFLDLSIDLGISGKFTSDAYRTSIEKVSKACLKHGKVFGVAGINDLQELQERMINTLGARFMLIQQDSTLISQGASRAAKAVPCVKA
ncbi:hypothetical protein UA08_04114 [Talaromyces atroroseus]|uniref:HpcH/HpaI aldolase/citrate lyase domain-containing protein n=1 Tax=Talaromyces atroroseus TaxID=1441469 RepID=A0A1Q5Q8Q9_TALAT|nr:hypothetical protein UA08_04114 [Talaromyces atroroseus]OKL60340.1 hypothetical protein UA08_04114 [Talaromyces atroroseus]